jgi:hypothetical protein
MAHSGQGAGGSLTLSDLQAYIGTDETGDFINSCLTAGENLVDNYIGAIETVPEQIHDQAVLICASELFHRRSAPNGIAQFASMDGSPVRVAKDPMGAVYPLLLPFVSWGV